MVERGPWLSKGYATMEGFCGETYSFFERAIARRFPNQRPSDASIAWRRSVATARGHLERYVPGNRAVERAVSALRAGRSVYIYGEKGIGKSAAMSYIIDQICEEREDSLLFIHFCGTAGDSS
jgi:Cdc6-like AAA superfamily ATPase